MTNVGCNCGQAWCHCLLNGSNGLSVLYNGSPGRGYEAHARIDPDDDNDLRETPDGLVVRVPAEIATPVGFRVSGVGQIEVAIDERGDEPEIGFWHLFPLVQVSFEQIIVDTAGIWDLSNNVARIPRDGWWEFGVGIDTDIDTVTQGALIMNNASQIVAQDGEHGQAEVLFATGARTLAAGDELSVFYGTDLTETTLPAGRIFWGNWLGR